MNMKDSPDLNQGELMRWVADATLSPLALLPPVNSNEDEDSTEELRWSEGDDNNSATLELKHHNTTARIHFHFNPDTHMLTSIHARRPRAVDGKCEMTHWEGYCCEWKWDGSYKMMHQWRDISRVPTTTSFIS